MRKLWTFILLLFLASSARAATEDQEEIVGYLAGTGTQTVTFLTPPTAGCTMTVSGAFVGDGIDIVFGSPEISDSDGNTYTITKSAVTGHQATLIAVANLDNVTPPFGVSFNFGGAVAIYGVGAAKSFCGLANPAIDKTATAAQPGPQPSDATVTTAATTQANETVLVAMGLCVQGSADSHIQTPTTGYASLYTNSDCYNTWAGNISWKNVTSIGAQSASWSHDDVTGSQPYDGWVNAIVTLLDAIPGGGGAPRRAVIIQ